jgi:NlpC/P60 family putative phage cell wall peptidase
MTRAEIVAEALSWVGTPWRHQACLKGVATDCIGLIAGVALACGSVEAKRFLETPEYRNYGREPLPAALLEACAELMDPLPLQRAAQGDVLCLKFLAEPMHFAYVVDAGRIVHAYASFGVVHHRYNETWQRRTVRAYSLRGIE